MERKIERVIDKCDSRCRYFQRFISEIDNHNCVYVCNLKPYLISKSSSKDAYSFDFPPFCPLEDYMGDKTEVFED